MHLSAIVACPSDQAGVALFTCINSNHLKLKPAIQTNQMNHSSEIAVCFGEVLWDILPTEALPGGAPMNVAYHLNQLGIETKMI